LLPASEITTNENLNWKIKITKNDYTRFWNPLGIFHNISEIEGKWYKCGTIFIKKR
jgi:hypothetical protein